MALLPSIGVGAGRRRPYPFPAGDLCTHCSMITKSRAWKIASTGAAMCHGLLLAPQLSMLPLGWQAAKRFSRCRPSGSACGCHRNQAACARLLPTPCARQAQLQRGPEEAGSVGTCACTSTSQTTAAPAQFSECCTTAHQRSCPGVGSDTARGRRTHPTRCPGRSRTGRGRGRGRQPTGQPQWWTSPRGPAAAPHPASRLRVVGWVDGLDDRLQGMCAFPTLVPCSVD